MTRVNHIVWETLTAPRRWIEAWYLIYAVLGIVSSGLVPVLLPLMMAALSPNVATVGYVVGAYNMGLATSPLWGYLADRFNLFRLTLLGGLAIEAGCIGAFPMGHALAQWFPLALGIGVGSAAVATCATLLVVEFHPRTEWTARIGWLQTFNGAGQVGGLLLAGLFAAAGFKLGLWTGAGLLAAALVVGLFSVPRGKAVAAAIKADPDRPDEHRGLKLDFTPVARFARVELLGGGIVRYFYGANLSALRNIRVLWPTRFGRFIASWFCIFIGVAGFFAYFPLFFRKIFHLPPATTSLVYAVAAGVGVALYTLAGRWVERFGARKVYFWGRLARVAGFGLLLAMMFMPGGVAGRITAIIGFGIVVMSWPVLSVTGTDLASELSPIGQGSAQGLNNLANAAGTVAGTYMAGYLIHLTGYVCIPIIALAGLALSLGVDSPLHRHRPAAEKSPAGA